MVYHKPVPVRRRGSYWEDRFGNKWSAQDFSQVEAAALASTMFKCVECINCMHCYACSGCEDCAGCRACVRCIRCTDCQYSTGLVGARDLENGILKKRPSNTRKRFDGLK